MAEKILEVRDLSCAFETPRGPAQALRGISFDLYSGEILGMVGESGSGKSVACLSLLGLIQAPGRVTGGHALFRGQDLIRLPQRRLQALRGRDIAMVFQDPMTALNPVLTLGSQLTELLRRHDPRKARKDILAQALGLLEAVGLPEPRQALAAYPHTLSGGMRQRALIAMALSRNPAILLADEPTTALDVTLQAQVLQLMRSLQRRLGTSVLLITHDLAVIAQTCGRVLVLYGGLILETGTVEEVFSRPASPYTLGLLRSMPDARQGRLNPIPGTPPDPVHLPKGCPFAPRCNFAMARCLLELPPFFPQSPTQSARCWLHHPQCPHRGVLKKEAASHVSG